MDAVKVNGDPSLCFAVGLKITSRKLYPPAIPVESIVSAPLGATLTPSDPASVSVPEDGVASAVTVKDSVLFGVPGIRTGLVTLKGPDALALKAVAPSGIVQFWYVSPVLPEIARAELLCSEASLKAEVSEKEIV